jgi:hypothetical protein
MYSKLGEDEISTYRGRRKKYNLFREGGGKDIIFGQKIQGIVSKAIR